MSKARGLADLGNVYDDGALSNRNLIINGAMQVAQRGASVTGVTSSGYRTCDRMEVVVNNIGTYTVTQENDAPEGLANSLKIDCTVADASPDSSDYFFFAHKLEGQNLQNLKKGTSDALPVTLSFWVKSNMTGTYQVNARDQDNVRYISASYTVNASGAWEYKTITLAGDTTGVLDNDANESLKLEWWLDSGSNFNSGTLNTSWTAADNANRNAGATVNIGASTSNYFQITGVQLEVGDTATPFEHRSYSDEIQRCERYFQLYPEETTVTGVCYNNDPDWYFPFVFPEMRTSPTVTFSNAPLIFCNDSSSDTTSVTSSANNDNRKSVRLQTQNAAVGSAGQAGWFQMNAANSYFTLDAEL